MPEVLNEDDVPLWLMEAIDAERRLFSDSGLPKHLGAPGYRVRDIGLGWWIWDNGTGGVLVGDGRIDPDHPGSIRWMNAAELDGFHSGYSSSDRETVTRLAREDYRKHPEAGQEEEPEPGREEMLSASHGHSEVRSIPIPVDSVLRRLAVAAVGIDEAGRGLEQGLVTPREARDLAIESVMHALLSSEVEALLGPDPEATESELPWFAVRITTSGPESECLESRRISIRGPYGSLESAARHALDGLADVSSVEWSAVQLDRGEIAWMNGPKEVF